ncbi:MAG: helix-turn-helix transcriptional regulator [Streptomycetales bacterium]
MSGRKTERLLNLVLCLLATRQYVTREEIRATVPGYRDCPTNDAFERMFERDKDELREMGIPLETGSNSAWFDDEAGYRIRPSEYALPDIALEPDEAAVLGVAARVWQQASLARAASDALLKLHAAGVETRDLSVIEPRVTAAEPAFGPLWGAVRDARPVSFRYRVPARQRADERHVDPWGIVSWHGRWYLAGHDRDREATRVFRLDRIVGEVRPTGDRGTAVPPEGVDVRALVAAFGDDRPRGTAALRVRDGAGFPLRRQALAVTPDGAGWDRVELPYTDARGFGAWLAGFGSDVVVIEPSELRDVVIRHLRAAAEPDRAPDRAASSP